MTVLDKDLRDKKKTSEVDVTTLAGLSYHNLISSMLERRLKHVATAFYADAPQSLFAAADSGFAGWDLAEQSSAQL